MEIPRKTSLAQQLLVAGKAMVDWVNNQPEGRFNAEIVAGKWSIAGHIYHLIKATKGLNNGMKMPKIGLRTMFGKNNRTERSFAEMQEKYKSALQQTNIKAPSEYSPAPGRTFDRAELLARFTGELEAQVQLLDKWSEEQMTTYILPHPAVGKCTIREMMYWSIIHTYHHLDILKNQYSQPTTA